MGALLHKSKKKRRHFVAGLSSQSKKALRHRRFSHTRNYGKEDAARRSFTSVAFAQQNM